LIPKATWDLVNKQIAQMVTVPKGRNEQESLAKMREMMITESRPCCAVFIGGMEGIIDEFKRFVVNYNDRPVYCIGAPGGAATELAENILHQKISINWDYKYANWKELVNSSYYSYLAESILLDVTQRIKS
jgi:hypothetical protein